MKPYKIKHTTVENTGNADIYSHRPYLIIYPNENIKVTREYQQYKRMKCRYCRKEMNAEIWINRKGEYVYKNICCKRGSLNDKR